jgi:hypothetical protein
MTMRAMSASLSSWFVSSFCSLLSCDQQFRIGGRFPWKCLLVFVAC